MGIAGLLPLLKSISKAVHLESFRGRSVAVDGYSWIHKGIYGSALEIYLNQPSTKFVEYCMSRVRLLLACQVTPIIVFDGCHLPMKHSKEMERAASRAAAKEKVDQAMAQNDWSSAALFANKCVDVTPDLAQLFILELRKAGVAYMIAPYEADAQLAYLNRSGYVDAVITEDSDLILFGCPQILFKLTPEGMAEQLSLQDLSLVTRDLNLSTFSLEKLRQMCVLSGCDYLPSLPKMGIRTAYKYFRQYQSRERVLRALRSSCGGSRNGSSWTIPEGYEEEFKRAEWTFLYQRVYCPKQERMVHLNDMPEVVMKEIHDRYGVEEGDAFLGPFVPDEIVKDIALAKRHPITKLPFTTISSELSLKQPDECIEMSTFLTEKEADLMRSKEERPPLTNLVNKNRLSLPKPLMTTASSVSPRPNMTLRHEPFEYSSLKLRRSLPVFNDDDSSSAPLKTDIYSPYFSQNQSSPTDEQVRSLPEDDVGKENRLLDTLADMPAVQEFTTTNLVKMPVKDIDSSPPMKTISPFLMSRPISSTSSLSVRTYSTNKSRHGSKCSFRSTPRPASLAVSSRPMHTLMHYFTKTGLPFTESSSTDKTLDHYDTLKSETSHLFPTPPSSQPRSPNDCRMSPSFIQTNISAYLASFKSPSSVAKKPRYSIP